MFVQLTQPLPRQSLPSRPRLEPHLIKVAGRAKVLRDTDCIGQVEHSTATEQKENESELHQRLENNTEDQCALEDDTNLLPPVTRNENRFSRILGEFIASKATVVVVML
jgi:hypothetical protein